MAKFPFNDLHSFKDYVGFVRMCAPEDFPEREGCDEGDQWSLHLAFRGLRDGLYYISTNQPLFDECSSLIEKSYQSYLSGDSNAGFTFLDEMYRKIKRIRSC